MALIPARILVVMGVASSGKTVTGKAIARRLHAPFLDGDDFHPAANKEKMSRGIPLDDYDRAPWLASIRAAMDDCLGSGQSAVFTCSGLKEKYRRVLMDGAPGVSLVYLACDFETSLARVGRRQNHYMKADMVKSQFEALEVPTDALTVDTKLPPDRILAEIRRSLSI